VEKYHHDPDRLDLDDFVPDFIQWYVSMQPASRFRGQTRHFDKMKAASDVPAAMYLNLRSTTQQGIVSLVHCLAWMFDCEWPTSGVLARIDIWQVIDEVSSLLKVMLA